MSINRVVLTGRLTNEVDLKVTSSKQEVVSFTLAVDNPVQKDKDKTTSFISCTAWNQQAKFMNTYCCKGCLIALDGRLSQRSYEGKNGKVYVTEVIVEHIENLTPKGTTQVQQDKVPTNNNTSNEQLTYDEDELPF